MNKLAEYMYDLSPSFLQNIGVTLYGYKVYRREYGRKFDRMLEQFIGMERYSREQLKEYQAERLRDIVKHSYQFVPYYADIMRQEKLKPADIRSVEDLSKFPVLTRDNVRQNFERLTATNAKKSDKIMGHTSGTTGSPLQFYYDRHSCLVKNVVDWRQKQWAGVNPGDRIAFFLGRVVVPIKTTKPPFWRENYLLNHLFFSSFHMSGDNIEHYIRKLEQYQPTAIEGYPSTVSIIARFLLSRNMKFPVKAVLTSSETLFPQQKEDIEQAFQCKLFDFYGLAERVTFATECEAHQGHHLNMDFGITELLGQNGEPAAAGEMGRIVATGLHNYSMPLIRYQTSDITSIRKDECSCGRAFPLMADVATKDEDIITASDGRLISASIMTHPFKPLHSIAESQIIQEDRNNIVIKIVKRETYTENDSRYLISELKKRVGSDMNITLQFVDSLPRTAAGKFKWVISKVPLEF